MEVLKTKLTYANVVATLALMLAVAGIPGAVAITKNKATKVKFPKSADITNKGQIKAGHVTASKLAPIYVRSGHDRVECDPGSRLLSAGAGVSTSRPLSASLPDAGIGPNVRTNAWVGEAPVGPVGVSVLCL